MKVESIEILNKVKTGELSPEEGAMQLEALDRGSMDQATPAEPLVIQAPGGENFDAETKGEPGVIEPSLDEEIRSGLGWWRNAWLIPFGAGTAILVLGALLMGWAFSSRHFFWFYCAWLPMLFGMVVLVISGWSQQARWVHIRVKDANGSNVAISLPLPLGVAGWALRLFGRFIPHLDPKVLEGLPEIFHSLAKEKGPTTVEVNEKDGSRVRVYIL